MSLPGGEAFAGPVRGRIMARITRPDRQVYIARAVLADHRYVEAHFDAWADIDIHGSELVQIAHDRVTLVRSAASYTPTLLGAWERGTGPAAETITEPERWYLAQRVAGYAEATFERCVNGLWYLRVTTPRGSYGVPRIPGESVDRLLAAAGFGSVARCP